MFPFLRASRISYFSNICITAHCAILFNYIDFVGHVMVSQFLAVASLSLTEVSVEFSSFLWTFMYTLLGFRERLH